MGEIIDRIRARQRSIFAKSQNMQGYHRQLDTLFEKIYFHEIDGRDKVLQRLQVPLVATIALAGLIGTMLQNLDGNATSWFFFLFNFFICIAISSLAVAGFFFVKASIGRTYSYLPVPESWLDYQRNCEDLYSDFQERDELVEAAVAKSLITTYVQCATKNGTVNAEKASYIFRILRFLIVAALSTFIAYAAFFFGRLDKNFVKAHQKVEIINPIQIERYPMATPKIPPPPPPPPAREIREDRPLPTSRPPLTNPGSRPNIPPQQR